MYFIVGKSQFTLVAVELRINFIKIFGIGYICKDNSSNGMQKLIESGTLPLNKLLVETDSPFLYPNARSSKLPVHVKNAFTQR